MRDKAYSKKEQTKMERAFEPEKDVFQVLHQIASDLREKNDQSIYKDWGIPYKDGVWFDVKVSGLSNGNLSLRLDLHELVGGYRVNQERPSELESRSKDTKKLFDKFERELKKEFKKRSGKALSCSKGKTTVNWELVALNGLYRFFVVKVCEVKTKLDGQTWPADARERKEKELK